MTVDMIVVGCSAFGDGSRFPLRIPGIFGNNIIARICLIKDLVSAVMKVNRSS